MTVLMVRLDDQGKIVKIEVERESGAPHLDEEAERAMRAAAPFPNLPEGLADEILRFLLAALLIGRLGMTSLASEREFSMRRLEWLDRSRREQG
jgi:TonB family protein